MSLIRIFLALFLWLTPNASHANLQASDNPNPYILDLREATDEQYREAIAFGSKLGVTMVVYSAQEAPWKLTRDAADLLAADGIPVVIARRHDRDDNPKDAEIVFVAKGKGRDRVRMSTEWKTMFYALRKEKGQHLDLHKTAKDIHRQYFAEVLVDAESSE